jgi:hypothetical protein
MEITISISVEIPDGYAIGDLVRFKEGESQDVFRVVGYTSLIELSYFGKQKTRVSGWLYMLERGNRLVQAGLEELEPVQMEESHARN